MSITGRITEKKLIKVRNCDYQNPIFLRWPNRLLGKCYYLFSGRYYETTKVLSSQTTINTDGDNYRPFDIEYMESFIRGQHKESRMEIQVTADNIDAGDREMLKTLADSSDVEILSNPTSWNVIEPSVGRAPGSKWEEVQVDGDSFEWGRRDHDNYSVNFTLILQPNINPRR